MIEIFEPGSPEYSRQRAEQELGAARAARLIKARAAHLTLAAAHLSERRPAPTVGKVQSDDLGRVLNFAFRVPDDHDCGDLLELLTQH